MAAVSKAAKSYLLCLSGQLLAVPAAVLGLPAGFAGALGMGAVFCGVTNCPLTAVLLSYELFGGAGLPLFALCIAVSYMLSGYRGLYSEQKIMYSKYSAEFVGKRSGDES